MSGFLDHSMYRKENQIHVRAIIYIVLQVPRVEVHQTCQFCNYQDTIFQFCPQLQCIRALLAGLASSIQPARALEGRW